MQLLEVDASSGWWFVILVFMGLAAIGMVALFIATLISVMASPRLTGGGKFIWVVLTFCFPILGPLVWFFWGRNADFSKPY